MELYWRAITGPAGRGPPDALDLGGHEVARMVERLDGTWFALLRYPGREALRRDCTSYASGRAGCETWARRHGAVLEADAERRSLEWLSGQRWRGTDSGVAWQRLEAMRQADSAQVCDGLGHLSWP